MHDESYPSPLAAWSTLLILLLAAILSFVDRQILNLLVEPIRRDLQINDTQMSLLMGLSFALFYVVCGIPFGRLADSRSRRGVIALGVLLWSGATAACGLAVAYWQFLLGRISVGVGEAALTPAAYSLLADSFPSERRATAFSIYAMGIYLGSGIAFLLGSLAVAFTAAQPSVELPLLGSIRSWQLVFILLGIVGLVFTLLLSAIREPLRQGVGAGSVVPLAQVFDYLLANRRTVLHHNLGFACLAVAGYGSSSWVPTFLMRTYGWSAQHAGGVYGGLVLVLGCLGILFGGRLSEHLARRGYRDANMRVGFLAALGALPWVVAFPLAQDGRLAALLLAPTVFCLSMPFGVAAAALQEIMPNPMRGQASSLYLLVITLIGLGAGPTLVALLTDYLFADDRALRYSLLLVSSVAVALAALLLGGGLAPYRRSVEHLAAWVPSTSAPAVVVTALRG
ncbi:MULTISPECIES: MFS transporter [unclassified Pseudomonas]|uniref:spinster family MFS transporter n=1 Tax=unclassified Pseudomonas TaxID=196821 RepID=UPI0007318F41|nr:MULTISPECIES: MFS transporter [unclassified Pseudomonas]KSW25805.1 MFS transporter [Pseudomonas sp. ADP]OBP12322.1 MFS transporter [Pseudomonas sp. EGD-AKN5]QOF82405.1 MFS transporter [Pseudomonas sp. ADPe]GLU42112.1 MFS transporter [Pseudomonas sp. NBRC 100443]